MVLADARRASRRHQDPGAPSGPAGRAVDPTRADALRRIAAEVSGRQDVSDLFERVLDEAFALFGVDRAAFWLYDAESPTPLRLAAQRGLLDQIVATVEQLPADAPTMGMDAIRQRRVRVLDRAMRSTTPTLRRIYRELGVRAICYVPLVFGDEALGLLVLYHPTAYAWTADEQALARAFGDQVATAIGSARLAASGRTLADRLTSIAELAGRLGHLQGIEEIAGAIVAEARRLLDHDTIRVYRVDHETGMCEPVAFAGIFMGTAEPDPAALRVAIGEGLTGWVAEHGRSLRIGDAVSDSRSILMGDTSRPESMLVVPMVFEEVVHGVVVVSAIGRDRFDADDGTTLSIFAAWAAQAIVNAANLERLQRQQAELELQLEGQRRLLEVNERLLASLDPGGVLDLIADSLKAIVPYDSLTIYRVDEGAGIRRAVIARDDFAELILADEGPIGSGLTGWVISHREAVLSNQAHLDPRSVQVPGTPFEPESIIVVPLLVEGAPIGTLNIGRMGEAASFSENEFELTKLFAGQASIALQNAETHGAVRVRAEQDALTGLRNHGAFQRELGESVDAGRPFAVLMLDLDEFKTFNDAMGHPAGDSLLAAIARAMSGAVRDGDRLYRYGGDEFAAILPGADRLVAHEVAERIRAVVSDRPVGIAGPAVTVSVGIGCYPDDGRTKDELTAVADRSLYLLKPGDRDRDGRHVDGGLADPYLRALDETALALLDRHDQDGLLETIIGRATALLGSPHGFVQLLDGDGAGTVIRSGTGLYAGLVGTALPLTEGLAGAIVREGRPLAVDDYDAWTGRSARMPHGILGSVVGVPLIAGGRVAGVFGLAAGHSGRRWGTRDIDALTSFAKLASIGLDNARLIDVAQRGALYDPTTGLPNRELLVDRIAHALAGHRAGDPSTIAVVLLDLDRFKVINESLGHTAGDRLLAAVGQRLVHGLRPGDTVARFGGDEYGIVLDPVADAAEAERIAERINGELRSPFPLNGREWFVSASLGIALAEPGRATPDELLREAEIAMVRAKGDATQRHFLFEPSMSHETLERLDLENDLRGALERDELRLHYQPIVDLRTDAIVGFEALVRWGHPTRGLVPPLAFIPLAEESGLIVPLGRWILETAVGQAAAWRASRAAGTGAPAPFVSVNLSAREFVATELIDDVETILAASGVEPSALELEITESVVMDQSETGVRTLGRLRDLGVRIVLDDFGTGYSSLSYLKHLPLDTIKIDRSFVAGLEAAADRSIVDAVIALAHGLGIGVVAEGIETTSQAELLRELGCDLGQGYLFSRPVPAAATGRLLRAAATARRARRARLAI